MSIAKPYSRTWNRIVMAYQRAKESHGTTQRFVARKAGLSDLDVSNYLRGHRQLSDEAEKRLAAALGVRLARSGGRGR